MVFVSEHKDANTTSCMTYLDDDAVMCALLYIRSKSALPFRISNADAPNIDYHPPFKLLKSARPEITSLHTVIETVDSISR